MKKKTNGILSRWLTKSALVGLGIFSTAAIAAWDDHFQDKSYKQYLHDEYIGKQYVIKNKSNEYAICVVAFNDGDSPLVLMLKSKETADLDYMFQDYENNDKYSMGLDISCTRYGPDRIFDKTVISSITEGLTATRKERGYFGYSRTAKVWGDEWYDNLYVKAYESRQNGEKVGKEVYISNTSDKAMAVCEVESKNFDNNPTLLFLPTKVHRLFALPTTEGRLSFLLSCHKKTISYDYSMREIREN
ncbi:hypothetical protein [Paraferrimonas sp. SM1919]|uniref:hypothetical protein n=1 Tax=Paraferrimonas sp. SM1919 TaxID=2662263 RepID=UPI0013D19060|nr:hypothetical protein [Paraferrimonas sp. SM1919]